MMNEMKKNNSLKINLILRNPLIIILLIFLILLTIKVSLLQFQTPDVNKDKNNNERFSAINTMEDLKNIAVHPHPIGSNEHERVKDYLSTALNDLGLSPEIQTSSTENVIPAWHTDYKGKIENIIARIPGENSSKAIVVTSHYDTVAESPGAGDASSGVVSILEMCRILLQSPPLKNDVIILITDGEEQGLLGSQAFVKEHPWAKDVGLVLNFDARGNKGPSGMFETSNGNGWIITEFLEGATNPLAHSFFENIYKFMPNNSDLTTFKNVGIDGLNFGFFEGLNIYHSPEDTVANLSLESLQQQGDYMLQLVRHFGNINIIGKEDHDKIFFNILGHKIITYSEKLVIPLMILAFIIFGLTFIRGYKRRKFSLVGASVSFLLFLVSLVLSYFLGKGLLNLLVYIDSVSNWTDEINLNESTTLFVGFIFIQILLNTLIYTILSKKINSYSLTIGPLFGWMVLTIFSSVWAKESSYIFIWPLLFGLFEINLLMCFKNRDTIWSYVITITFIIPIILITAPLIYIFYMLLTMDSLPILLVLVTLSGVFLIPIFGILHSSMHITRSNKTN